MSDEQLVAAWLRMLNEQRSFYFGAGRYDLNLAGRQALTADIRKPVTREHLVARVEQLIMEKVNDRLQST